MNAENVAVNISGILPYPRKFIINNNSQLPPLHEAHNYNLKQSCSSSFSSLYISLTWKFGGWNLESIHNSCNLNFSSTQIYKYYKVLSSLWKYKSNAIKV